LTVAKPIFSDFPTLFVLIVKLSKYLGILPLIFKANFVSASFSWEMTNPPEYFSGRSVLMKHQLPSVFLFSADQLYLIVPALTLFPFTVCLVLYGTPATNLALSQEEMQVAELGSLTRRPS